MPATTSTSLLTGAATGTLAITSPGVVAGTASMPVLVGAPDGTKVGVFIVASPDFVGAFTLQRHGSGFRAGDIGTPQTVLRGDNVSLAFAAPGALANLSGMDSVTTTLTNYSAGSLVLSVVQ